MSDFLQGTQVTLYANYVDGQGTPILAGISGVTVDLYHYAGATRVFDITSGTMTQNTLDPNRFYYNYVFDQSAPVTSHIAEYSAMFSGQYIQNTEQFSVLPATSNFPTTGIAVPGSVTVSGTVVNVSGSGIVSASVTAALLTGSNTVVAGAVTDASGLYTIYLNPDDYFMSYTASGFFPNQTTKTVGAGPFVSFGDTTLVSTNGSNNPVVISDSYLDGDRNNTPMSGLRIALFYKGQKAAGVADAIAVSYTNVSGIFAMSVSPGDNYVLLVQGRSQNNEVIDTAYDIDVDPFLGDSTLPANFRYLGTTQYDFIL